MAAAGKVITGYSDPYVALYNNNEGVVTYTNCQKLARGVSVSVDPESSDENIFYADDVAAESAGVTFTGGSAAIGVDGLLVAAERFIMGLPTADTDGWTDYDDDQSIPYLGFGCVVRAMADGIESFTPYVLYKVKFDEIPLAAETQEDEIDWQTTELNANLFRSDAAKHRWRGTGGSYSTRAEAVTALVARLS